MIKVTDETAHSLFKIVEAHFGMSERGSEVLGQVLAIVQDELDNQARRVMRWAAHRSNRKWLRRIWITEKQ
jgi:hypothetical protein